MWGVLVYKEETSTVAMMVSGDRGLGRDRIMSSKWFISWNMGGEGFNKELEVGINVSRGAFSRGTMGGDDGTLGVVKFV